MAGCLAWAVIAGCGGANGAQTSSVSSTNAALTISAASCAAQTPAQDCARARLIFYALALPGRSAPRSQTLLSSARFRVLRYFKGHGPKVVEIPTAVAAAVHRGEYSYVEDGIDPEPVSDGSSTASERGATR